MAEKKEIREKIESIAKQFGDLPDGGFLRAAHVEAFKTECAKFVLEYGDDLLEILEEDEPQKPEVSAQEVSDVL